MLARFRWKTALKLGCVFLGMTSAAVQASELEQVKQFEQLQQQKKSDSRFADFFEALQKSPRDPQVHLQLAQLYLEQNLLELAAESFRCALILNPRLAEAHVGLSHLYRKKRLKALEVKEMETAVQVAPEAPRIRFEMGVLYMEPESFDYKKAKAQYKALQKLASPLAVDLARLMQIDS